MKKKLLISVVSFLLIGISQAQNSFSFNCPKDTTIDCAQTCVTLTSKIPDVRASTDDYGVNLTSGPGGCFRAPIAPGIPGTSTNLDQDDMYTPVIPMPFDFPFYGIIYAQLIVNTNGIISFDLAEAGNTAQWTILAGEGSLPTDAYDRNIIMGAYHDIDIQFPNTSPTKQIKYDVIGTAPHRKWILTFYKVPCYSNACWPKINNTYQITLYEGLGLVDVHVWGREICTGWNSGNAMIGMQNYDRDKGVMAPGREAWTTPRWGAPNMNESWRFTPKVGPSLLKKVELADLSGAIVANGEVSSDGNNGLDVVFDNVCLNTTTQYVVKTQYYNYQYPFQFPASDSIVYATDTITVYKSASVPPITLTTTQAQCGANPNGSITITSPVGAGYEYSLDGGSSYQSSPAFSVPAGTYTVTVHNVSSTCTRDTTVTISAPSSLSGSAVSTNTTCPEALNGTITITGSLGTGAGTYTYAIDNIASPVFGASNVFPNLSSGDHMVFVKDGAGCIYSFTHNIASDPVFTTTGSSVNASCLGALNGTLTVTPPSSGQAPFTYSIPGGTFGTYQSSPIFNGLVGDSTYTVNVKDNFGCVFTFTQPVGYDAGVTATFITRSSSCSGIDNGYIVLNPANGAAPYFYQIDTGTAPSFTALDTIRNLGPGLYDVTIRDNIGCLLDIEDISVSSGTGVNATFDIFSSACAAVSTGYISMSTNFSGTAPFAYSVNSGSFQNFVGNSRTDTARNLAPGNYVITIRDAVGCLFTSQPLTVGANPDIQASFVTIPTACAVATTGQIVITPLTGAGPFSYSLDNAAYIALSDTIRNLDSGFHSIIIRDAIGCATTITPEITLGTGVNATFSTINSACTAANTGKIVATVTAGISPYTYSIDAGVNFYPLDTIRNLTEGTYTVLIRDGVGCEFSSPVTVNSNNPGVGATFATVNSACTGVSTGQIIITPTLGVAPFSYSTDGGTNYLPLDTIRNLAGTTYNIRVRDGLGCAYDAPPVTVGNNAGVAATFTTVNSACAVASTGRIIPSVSFGTSPFVYSIDGGTTFQPLDTVRNLAGGPYTVLIRDGVGCEFSSPVTVNSDNPGVGATFATVNSACTGVSTGQIIITPTVGVAPFSYSTDGGTNYLPLDTIRNLAGTTYNIRVRDGLGCAYDAPPVTVGNNAGVAATFTTVNSACAVASTGRIIPSVSSGTSPFVYSIDGGTTFQPLDTVRNLAGGPYTVLIRDAVGCQLSSPVTVNSDNPGVGATFATVNSACSGVSTGKIIITPTIGVAPFSYSTNGGITYLNVDTIRNVAANTYNIKIKDALGCTFDAPPVTVGNNIGVTSDFAILKTACATVATGVIITKPLTGARPFSYSLDGGTTYKPDSVFRNLAVSTYNVRIRDAVGCVFDSPVQNVGSEPGVLTNASTIQNASCASIPNGSITINVTAGIAPFTYLLTSPTTGTPQASNLFSSLFSGNYDVSITDSAGCTKTVSSVVGNNPKVQIDSFNIIRPTCNGVQNGTITVNVSLGVAPYEYAIDNGPFSSSKIFSSVGAGSHILKIRDANNCSIDSTITITEPVLLTASITGTTEATCSGNPDGKIIASAAGGTLPYEYTLDQAGLTGYQSATSFDVLKGNYMVTVKDGKGCIATVNTTVDSVFTMFLDLGDATTLCSGSTITLNPITNAETTVFTYSPKATLDNENIKNPVASPTQTTTYTLTAKWGICTLIDDVTITVLRKPVPNAGNDVIICHDTTTTLSATASNLSGTVNYTWSPANLIDTKVDSSVVTVRPQDEDTYFVVTVRDNYNCNFAVSDSVLVKMLPPVYAFAGNDTNAVLNKPHQLYASGAGIGGSYLWDYPAAGVSLSDRTLRDPQAIFTPVPGVGEYSPNDTNYYKLIVTATNAAGCKATDTIKINVFVGTTCYVPSAFSPNGDGINDLFKPVNVGINIEYFKVFNRYGETVYQTNRFRDGWNGFFKGKEQPSGAYVWVFKGKDNKGREIVQKGTVMLIR
jgi:gliding motility-associated-like protein